MITVANRVYAMSVTRTWESYEGVLAIGTTTVVSDDEWRLTNIKGDTLTFNEVGELQAAENRRGEGITYLDGCPGLPGFLMISDEEFGMIEFTPIS